MRPLSLTMQAFGPFAGTEHINFAELGEAPLFLINGPTGSGKTTILDAICYALYGSTTGNEREAKEMRCQQSDPELLTEVIFEFSLKGESYHIKRSPDQDRPKIKGKGMTQHLSRADLYRLGPDGTKESGELLVEKKVSDAADKIRELTGMNADQFRQVMVLPQGQFRKLLMADSKDKQKIFESLFETTLYTKIEERLKEDSRDIRDSVAHADSVIRNILETGGVTSSTDLAEQLAAALSELTEATAKKERAEQTWQQSKSALEEATKLQADFENLEAVKSKESQLVDQAPKITADKGRAQQSRAAEKLKAFFDRVQQARSALDSSTQEVQRAAQALAAAETNWETADKQFQTENAREPERTAAAAEVHRLQSYEGKVDALIKAKAEMTSALDQESRGDLAAEQCQAALTSHEAQEHPIRTTIDALEKAIADAGGIELTVHKLKAVLAARVQLARVEADLVKTEKAATQARDTLATADSARGGADKALKRLRQEWHQGQAAILAQELEEGIPCPVCGSPEHPSPALHVDQTVNDEQLEQANAELDDKIKAVIAATAKLTGYAERVASLQAQQAERLSELGENAQRSESDMERDLENAVARSKKLVEDRKKLTAEQTKLQEHSVTFNDLRGKTEQAKATLAAMKQTAGEARLRVELSEQALPEAYREVGQLKRKLAEAVALQTDLETQLEAARQAVTQADKSRAEAVVSLNGLKTHNTALQGQLASATGDATEALASSVFATEEEMKLALMQEDALRALDKAIADYDIALLETRTTRKTLEGQLKGKQPGDLAALQAAESSVRAERDGILNSWRVLDQRTTRLQDTQKNLESKLAEKSDLDAKYRVVGTLADVACGLKGSKISLQRYILGVLLDDVLVQSTQRLMKMSDGRYELRRKLEPGKGNRASGLDLEVYDDYSGESRSVATLSGGESFMAALSLALGLSDVVQAQTGGIQLDTLFVDEGFGTLDSEALELAVATLMELQKSGRMVGIISHVSELREQMDVRIDLSKCAQRGSRLKIVSPMVHS